MLSMHLFAPIEEPRHALKLATLLVALTFVCLLTNNTDELLLTEVKPAGDRILGLCILRLIDSHTAALSSVASSHGTRVTRTVTPRRRISTRIFPLADK